MRREMPRGVQQATFYFAVASAIVFSVYWRNSQLLGRSGMSLASIAFSPDGAQLLAAGILLASSAVSLLRRRAGALLALGGSIVAGVAYAGSFGLGGWFVVLAAFIARSAWPLLFWGYLFPLALLAFAVAYSRRVREHPDDSPTVWYWLRREHWTATSSLAVVTSLVSVLTLFANVQVYENIQSYRVELEDESTPSRPHDTALAFVDYPCYELYTSSESLHEYALSTQDGMVDIVFERRLTFAGVWFYEVQQVGEWEGSATFHGPRLTYSVGPGEEPDCAPRGPLSGSYNLVTEQQD